MSESFARYMSGMPAIDKSGHELLPVSTADCGHGVVNGEYGVRRSDGATLCKACCADDTRRRLRVGEPMILYYEHRRKAVTDFLGGLDIPVFAEKKSIRRLSWGGEVERYDVWFTYGDGRNIWHGVNIGDNQIVRCRRLKRKSRVSKRHYVWNYNGMGRG